MEEFEGEESDTSSEDIAPVSKKGRAQCPCLILLRRFVLSEAELFSIGELRVKGQLRDKVHLMPLARN